LSFNRKFKYVYYILIQAGQIFFLYIFMTSRTHDLIAFGSLLTVAVLYPPRNLNIPTLFSCLIGNIIGALMPDMDQATNRLWDLLPAGNAIGRIFRRLMISHRTISHSILGIFIIYHLLKFIIPKVLNPVYIHTDLVIFSILTGFISHIAADSLTREGIPLFFPVKFKIGFPPFEFLRITTGKFMEKFIIFPGVLAYIIWLVYYQKDLFLSLIKLIKN
jgi:inner membrane protein